MKQLWALVMAGGKGTRLWPKSRQNQPKQFLRLFGDKSLIENTIERISSVVPQHRIFIITDKANVQKIRRLFPKIPPSQIIGEPSPRNTAAAIGLGAALIQKKDPKAVFAVFPSDHVILNISKFKQSIFRAAKWAAKAQRHVLFGVKPTYPSTAYGYVERAGETSSQGVYRVRRFIEKPDQKKAESLLRSKKNYWQAGIFVWRVDTILNSIKRFLPKHDSQLSRIAAAWKTNKTGFALPQLFSSLPNISIDYGVMEKLETIYMVPAAFDWSDIGSWNALEQIWSKDADSNAFLGHCVAHHSKRNLVYSPVRLTCLLGVHDLAVVDTEDAMLVCSKSEVEKVKDLVELLKRKKLTKYL